MSLAILGMSLLGSCKKDEIKDEFSVQEKSITWRYDLVEDLYYADILDSRITDFVMTNGAVDVEIKDAGSIFGGGYLGLPATLYTNEVTYTYKNGNVHLECYSDINDTEDPINDLGLGTVKITVYKDLAAKRKSTPSFGKQKVKSIH